MKKLLPLFALLAGCASGPELLVDPSRQDEVRFYMDRAVHIYNEHNPNDDAQRLLDHARVVVHEVSPHDIVKQCGPDAAACTRKNPTGAGQASFTLFVPWDDMHLATHETMHVILWMAGVPSQRHHLYMIEMRLY